MCLTLPLSTTGWTGLLPLCAASARLLEQALWLVDETARAEALLRVLRIDPALTCFLVAELLPVREVPSPGLAELAALAAPSLAATLDGKLAVAVALGDASPEISLQAAESVVLAEVVRRLAEEHRCAHPASFELAALAAGGAILAPRPVPSVFEWLSQEVGLPDVAPFCSVAENLLATHTPPPPASGEALPFAPVHHSTHLLENCEQRARAVRAHGELEDATAASDLLRLVARLAPLELLQCEFQSRLETEKLLAMKELAYGAGHEINNPLANISVRAQTLIKQEQDPERRRMLAAINGQVYRAHEMIADLMLFAQPPQMTPCETELQPLIEKTVTGLLPDAARQNSTLFVQPAKAPVVANIDPIQIALALQAMIVNALEAMGQGGRIELQASQYRGPRGERWAEIRISDDGPGIEAEVRRHLFDPFYSGREAGRGLGFGLSKCWRIVTAHGGRIDVESSPGRGACFVILLPA